MTSNTITIDTSALIRWAEALKAGSESEVQKYINLGLKKSANIVQRQESIEVPRGDTGKLVRSLRQIVTTFSATIGPSPDYSLVAGSVDGGTRPHMPPVESIREWAENRGINPWALAMSIKRKGTKANPFVNRTFMRSQDDVITEFQTVTQLIADFVLNA